MLKELEKVIFKKHRKKYFYIVTCKIFNINFMCTLVYALLLNTNAENFQSSSATFGQGLKRALWI